MFDVRSFISCLAITRSSVLGNIDKFEISRNFLRVLGSRLGFLSMGFMIACLYNDGTMPLFSDLVNISRSSLAISCKSLICSLISRK